jgi:hypothetical protein
MGPEIRSTNRCLLILSNEEKRMIMKILKKGDSREKRGGGYEIHAPCACDKINRDTTNF